MPTVEDLGKQTKERYPGEYDDMSDLEVGRRMKARFPGSYDDFTDSMTVPQPNYVIPMPSSSMEKTVAELQEYYNPQRGRLASWWQRGKAESRTKLLRVLTQEQFAFLEQATLLEQAAMNSGRNRLQYERFVAEHAVALMELKLKSHLVEQALEQGLDIASTIEVNRTAALNNLDLDKLRGVSDIKVDEHKRLSEIDLDNRWKEIIQDLNSADLLHLTEQQVIKKLRDDLVTARRERYYIETSDEPKLLKEQILGDYDNYIANLERKIREREAEPVSAKNGENNSGHSETTTEGE